jgi:hypothetical protein
MELSDIDISQISVPEGIRLERISFHQVENKNKKKQKQKEEKSTKDLQIIFQSFFQVLFRRQTALQRNDFSGEAEDINPTDR